MPECEICGKKTDKRWIIKVDNSKLKTCEECSTHGKKIKREGRKIKEKKKTKKKTKTVKKRKGKRKGKELVPDYSKEIRKARERKELSQEKLSRKINEHESRVRKIEKGKMKPTPKLARKLEKELEIDLYQKPKEVNVKKTIKDKGKITIGDIIKMKSE